MVGGEKGLYVGTRTARTTRVPRDGSFQVVVRRIPDGGRALARARELVIDRFLEEVLPEPDGGERHCGQ